MIKYIIATTVIIAIVIAFVLMDSFIDNELAGKCPMLDANGKFVIISCEKP